MRTGRIRMTIDSHLEHVFLVGLAVNHICRSIPMSEQLAYEAEVSVVEALNNVITHGYRNRAGHPVDVEVSVELGRVVFTVSDRGTPMEHRPATLPEAGDNDREALAEGGRGLYIMRAFTDHVTYSRVGDHNVLTLVKLLPMPGAWPVRPRAGKGRERH
jgi:serine/threonine-protein kinase RsbW